MTEGVIKRSDETKIVTTVEFDYVRNRSSWTYVDWTGEWRERREKRRNGELKERGESERRGGEGGLKRVEKIRT